MSVVGSHTIPDISSYNHAFVWAYTVSVCWANANTDNTPHNGADAATFAGTDASSYNGNTCTIVWTHSCAFRRSHSTSADSHADRGFDLTAYKPAYNAANIAPAHACTQPRSHADAFSWADNHSYVLAIARAFECANAITVRGAHSGTNIPPDVGALGRRCPTSSNTTSNNWAHYSAFGRPHP